jgi:hypothetical protein
MEFRTEQLVALLATLLVVTGIQAQKVYRWVDKDGNVHYTESLPPDHVDSGHDVLNQQGIVLDENLKLTPEQEKPEKTEEEIKAAEAGSLPRDASGLPRPKPLYSETEKQARMDNLLLLRFDSEQEIVDAMNVEIRQLNYDRGLLEGSRDSAKKSYRDHLRVAANKQRAGNAVSAEDKRRMKEIKSQLDQVNREIAGLDRREDRIRAEFLKTLDRYRALLEKYSEENPG